MIIGIPKEVKDHEYRVGLTPSAVAVLVQEGHRVMVQSGSGDRIGFTDRLYESVGAQIVKTAEEVYEAEMIVKVKEPVETEYPLLKENQILYCFLHLAPNPQLTQALIDSKCIAIAYETVTDSHGHLPLLLPMSEIAGRISIQVGADAIQMVNGGKGVLLGGAPGVHPAKVVIIGGGVAGTEAARMAMGLGADVTVLDRNLKRLKQLDLQFSPMLKTLFSNSYSIAESMAKADLVIGSVLIPGKSAPRLITREMIRSMEPGSVFVDISIDQGGCAETSKPTTHSDPIYKEEGVVHYCVTNMPGACSKTASQALTNATMFYAIELANKGYTQAFHEDPDLLNGLNVCKGHITNEAVASDLGYEYVEPEKVL